MDPNACLRVINVALQEGDHAEAREAARNLIAWRTRGGFRPDGTSADDFDAWLRKAARSSTARPCKPYAPSIGDHLRVSS
jgi:hypothetical protein